MVTIRKIDILDIDMENFVVIMDVCCSKGTYIRTLCEDIGMALGCGAFVTRLERRKSGVFKIEESYTLEELLKIKEEGKLSEIIIKPDRLFLEYPEVVVNEKCEERVKNGAKIRYNGLLENSLYRVYSKKREFLAISRYKDGELLLEKPFWER